MTASIPSKLFRGEWGARRRVELSQAVQLFERRVQDLRVRWQRVVPRWLVGWDRVADLD